jgi:hypothetical protein|tara:strand:- start:14256 stop:15026 length:771 start_codon:yes stop_codon:yes gene_type:complete
VDALSFFVRNGTSFVPQEAARGWWRHDSLHGRALVGLMGAEIALRHGAADWVPARFTIDMVRIAPFAPARIETHVVRAGPRMALVEATMMVNDATVARATMQFLRFTQAPPGRVWAPPPWDAPDPAALPPMPDGKQPRHFEIRAIAGHLGAVAPKRLWLRETLALVAGEPLGPYARVALAADFVSAFVHAGDAGIRYINSDVSLHLHRPPQGEWIGFEATGHEASDGIAVGHCRIHDRNGAIGFIACTALANERRK